MHGLQGLRHLASVWLFLLFLASSSKYCYAQQPRQQEPQNIREVLEAIYREMDELKAQNKDLRERVIRLENCMPGCAERTPGPTTSIGPPTQRPCSCVNDGRCDSSGACRCPSGFGGVSCEVRCSNPCLLRGPDPGTPCDRQTSTRFYFDPVKGQCRRFQYSGCGGNANNFRSFRSCDAQCARGACCYAASNVTSSSQVHGTILCLDQGERDCRRRGDVVTFQPGLPAVRVKVYVEDRCLDSLGKAHPLGSEVSIGCQSCTCIKGQGLPRWTCRCDRVWQRRELRDLRPSEVTGWQAALRRLRQDGRNVTSPWEEMRDLYVKHVMVAQNPRYFLAWHRLFLRLVEQKLQEIDCDLTIPYFDFTTDSGALHRAIIWQPNYFGGPSHQGPCVTDHPFDRHNDSRFCIERSFNQSVSVPTILDVMYALKTNSFLKLSKSLQTIVAHVHMNIGGTMMTSSSPLDPVFLPLYAFIDQLFWFWQTHHPNTPLEGQRDVMEYDAFQRPLAPFSTALKHVWNSRNDLCVTYVPQSEGHPCHRTNGDQWSTFKDSFSGYTPEGYDQNGFDISGFHMTGYDRDGYDIHGNNKFGFNVYDNIWKQETSNDLCVYKQGFDQKGFNVFGFDRAGNDRTGCNYKHKGPHINGLVLRVWKYYFRQTINFLSSLPSGCPGLLPVNPVWLQNMWINRFTSVAFPSRQTGISTFGPYNTRLCIEITSLVTTCGCNNPTVCRSNPCVGATCQNYPNAICQINVCSQVCEVFWVWEGREVNCQKVLPVDGEDKKTNCNRGGTRYNIGDKINVEDPCQECICKPMGIKCKPVVCRPLNCARKVQVPGQCCPVCQKTCNHKGRIYQDGSTVPSRPCRRCICQAGRVRCSRLQCGAPLCSNPVTPRGGCCPVCSDCVYENEVIQNNESVTRGCTQCRCLDGNVTCERVSCPPLTCPNPVTPAGKCCPECPPEACNHQGRVISPGVSFTITESCQECVCSHSQLVCGPIRCPSTNCRHPSNGPCCPVCQGCRYGGLEFKQDERFVDPRQPCLQCHCRNGNVLCNPKECPPHSCSHPHRSADGCCPECRDCLYGNKTYRHKQDFQKGCERCICENGSVMCQPIECPSVTCRYPTQDECCPSCEHGCLWEGRNIAEGQRVPHNDQCQSCQCQKGDITCTDVPCPPVNCSHPVRGQCCSECNNCFVEGRTYQDGQLMRSDNPCEECRCNRGNRICQLIECPPTDCRHPVQGPCCKECSGCQWKGQTLREGQRAIGEPCETCSCLGGSVRCRRVQCPGVACLNPVKGPCCSRCDLGCSHEGSVIPEGGDGPTWDPCRQCKCLKGSIQCIGVPCPPVDCTHPGPGRCCQECDKCSHNGITYNDGDPVRGNTTCEECYCRKGSVICNEKVCPPISCQHPVQGQCCLECNLGCQFNQIKYSEGNPVPSERPCEECICQKGSVTCSRRVCPSISCQYPVQGQCCQRCDLGCQYNRQIYPEGNFVPFDKPCEECTCQRGSVTCRKKVCESVSCQHPVQGRCCLECNLGCQFDQQIYPPSSPVPSKRPCEECVCQEGSVRCKRKVCQPVSCQHPVQGQCCLQCDLGCRYNQQTYVENSPVPSEKQCEECYCQGGSINCRRKTCPAVPCEHPVTHNCCPECTSCLYDGKVYDNGLEFVSSDSCQNCKCIAGTVQCIKIPCPNFSPVNCKTSTMDRCGCQICTEYYCAQDDVMYSEGHTFISANCETCICRSGNIECEPLPCEPVTCQNPVRSGCCPSCGGCRFQGGRYSEDEEFDHPDDECAVCMCQSGNVSCRTRQCPAVTCPHPVLGKCCQVCPQGCVHNNVTLTSGESVADHCNNCTCQNGSVMCRNITCPSLDCQSPETLPGQCCPSCRSCIVPSTEEDLRPDEVWTDPNDPCHTCSCKSGENWQVDECTSCFCDQGRTRCETKRCQNQICTDHTTLTMVPGQCCPVCKPTPGTCIGFGDPHYRTFDGLLLHFQGLCSYIMAADCVDGAFKVIAKHHDRVKRGRVSWIESLHVEIKSGPGMVTVDLLHGGQVKVNGETVRLPFLHKNDISVERGEPAVILNTNIGVQVLWNGDGFVELSVSGQYRDNVCGLCGNFNGIPPDDLTTPEGTIAKSHSIYGKSWKVEDSNCTDEHYKDIHPCTSAPYRLKSYAIKQCEILKGEVFASCHNHVKPEEFYASCLYDLCGCGFVHHRQSLCDVLSSYARECSRAGVHLQWRSPQLCGVGCPPESGLLWDEYGPTCARNCDNRDLPIGQLSMQCTKPCVAGCHCPPHLVLHDGSCIQEDRCP